MHLSVCVFQDYCPAGQANQVHSLMRLMDMLMHEPVSKEDSADNKHLRFWLAVTIPFSIASNQKVQ